MTMFRIIAILTVLRVDSEVMMTHVKKITTALCNVMIAKVESMTRWLITIAWLIALISYHARARARVANQLL